jgi:hypothetical protein
MSRNEVSVVAVGVDKATHMKVTASLHQLKENEERMKGSGIIDTVAKFLVYCPHEKKQGYRAEQVL